MHSLLSISKKCILLCSLALLSACATNPVSGSKDFVLMSEKQELRLGQQYAAQLSKTLNLLKESDPLSQYVNTIGQKMAAVADRSDLYFRFQVVDDATLNAFALPGGYIYIHRGLLVQLNSEAELAAVLGHEIGHVTARHAVKQYTKSEAYRLGMAITSIFVPVTQTIGQFSSIIATGMIRGYGRDDELQSDELAISYMQRAGYDTKATIALLQTLKRMDDLDTKERKNAGEKVKKYHGAFSTHPETSKRIRLAVEKHATSGGLLNKQAMLNAVKNYPYADNSNDGAVIGQRFIHPDLGIQLHFPKGWFIKNTPEALVARLKKEKVFFRMQMENLQKRETVSEILKRDLDQQPAQIKTAQQHGYESAHATVNMAAPNVRQARVHANILRKQAQAFHLTMWSERDNFMNVQKDFDKIVKSFRPYDVQHDAGIPRIHLHRWKKKDQWLSLAKKYHDILGDFTAERLASLNGMDFDQTPPTGTWIKLVY
ncbi:MAG: M48 family metalloprotease [Mariprofundaceae bacterium]|nr:M48 family metalloprotease [Mariprofundaceae bacterium]